MIKRTFQLIVNYFEHIDKLFFLLTLTASVYGCILIASMQRDGGVNFLKTQITAVCIGFGVSVLLSRADYRSIARLWLLIAGFALLLTFSVFFVGIQVSGTDDVGWIRLPGGMTFQPSEITKACFIMTFSKHLAYLDETGRLKSFIGVMTLLLHGMIPAALIHIQGDDGAALVFVLMFIIMSFAAGVQLRYFIFLGVIITAALPLLWFRVLNIDQKSRLTALFSSDDSMFMTYGWQQYQGRISISSGGMFGRGLFHGTRVERNAVPYQENDFIFTVAGEELGFIGCIAIVLILAFVLLRVLIIAGRTKDLLGRSICIGFFALTASQVMLNLGMVLGLLPVIGVTLPFFSSGGTSAACICLCTGLVQSVYATQNGTVMHRRSVSQGRLLRVRTSGAHR